MTRRRIAWGIVFLIGLAGARSPAVRAEDVEAIKARLAAVGGADKYDSAVVVVLDGTEVVIRDNGIGVATKQRVVKILRESAIKSEAVQTFTYDPHTNRLDLIAVRVYRVDGQIEEVSLDNAVNQAQPSHALYWGSMQYVVQLPRLAVGDAYETVSKLTGFNVAYLANDDELNALGVPLEPPVAGHWHDEVQFWSGVPVIEKRYSVRTPTDKPLQYEIYNCGLRTSLLFENDHLVYTFIKENIEPFKGEADMEAVPNVGCKLLLATLPDWETKSQWLYGVSEPQLEPDDEIRAAVAEIIKHCKTDEEKYTALNHWVAENIRYAGTTRGMAEGYTIHDIKETFRDRLGVCKDKAGMLCGMLRVAGFESYTCMTMARQRVDRVPADQFNHCVTSIRDKDGNMILLDPTWMPKSRDNWSTLEPEQHVVYGTPEGMPLSTSPYFPPEDCLASWKAKSEIDQRGKLSGRFEFSATGAPEGRLRRALAGRPPEERYQIFDGTIQRLAPNAQAVHVTYMDPVDFSGPFKLSCDYVAENYPLGGEAYRIFGLPMLQTVLGDRTIYDILGKNGLKERKYALKLMATRLCRFEETVVLPAGWSVVEKPEPVSIDGPSASLKFEIEAATSQIRYTCELAIKKWQIPPDEYANFKEVMDKFDELTGRTIVCKLEAASVRR